MKKIGINGFGRIGRAGAAGGLINTFFMPLILKYPSNSKTG